MKYSKRRKQYENSTRTNTFDPETMAAHSYGHWQYLKRYGNVLIFNNHYYSSTTCKHQTATWSLLDIPTRVNIIKIDTEKSLDKLWRSDIIMILKDSIRANRKKASTKRTRKKTKELLRMQNKIILMDIRTLLER